MSDQTTPVNVTQEIKKIWNSLDGLIIHKMRNKQSLTEITLTPVQYKFYCEQIKDDKFKGNPLYRGVEIKKMGGA